MELEVSIKQMQESLNSLDSQYRELKGKKESDEMFVGEK